MQPETYIESLKQFPYPETVYDFEALARYIEENLTLDYSAEELEQLNQFLYSLMAEPKDESPSSGKKYIWHVILTQARFAPLQVAASFHAYGRHVFSSSDNSNAYQEYMIARLVYQWAKQDNYYARVSTVLVNELFRLSRYDEADYIGEPLLSLVDHLPDRLIPLTLLNNLVRNYSERSTNIYVEKTISYADILIGMINDILDDMNQSQLHYTAMTFNINALLYKGVSLGDYKRDYASSGLCYDQAEDMAIKHFKNTKEIYYVYINQIYRYIYENNYRMAFIYISRAKNILNIINHDNENIELIDVREIYLLEILFNGLLNNSEHVAQNLENFYKSFPKHGQVQSERDLIQEFNLLINISKFSIHVVDEIVKDALPRMIESVSILKKLNLNLQAGTMCLQLAKLLFSYHQPYQSLDYLNQAKEIFELHAPQMLGEIEACMALYDDTYPMDNIEALYRDYLDKGNLHLATDLAIVLGKRLNNDPTQALHYFLQATQHLEQNRIYLQANTHAFLFLQQRRIAFEQAFILLKDSQAEQALQVIDKLYAQVLVDELYSQQGVQLLIDRNSELQKITTYRQSLMNLNPDTPRYRSTVDTDFSIGNSITTDERKQIEYQYIEALNEAQSYADETVWLNRSRLDVAELQSYLGSSKCFIGYVVTTEGEPKNSTPKSTLRAIIVSGEHITIKIVSDSNAFNSFIKSWHRIWEQDINDSAYSMDEFCKDLFDSLVHPVIHELSETTTELIVCFDEQMPFVPLHAAYNEQTQTFLCQRYAVSYAPSAWALLHCVQRDQQRNYDVQRTLLAGLTADGLKYVEAELQALSYILDTDPHIDTLSCSDVLSMLGQSDLIHLACHGAFTDEAFGRFSALRWKEETISAQDIYAVPLKAGLLTLSACDLGRYGKGMQGMISAALVSGASTVLAALWPVRDDIVEDFMTSFYEGLVDKQLSRAQALQAAQIQFINHHDKNPFLWAPFFMLGVGDHMRGV